MVLLANDAADRIPRNIISADIDSLAAKRYYPVSG